MKNYLKFFPLVVLLFCFSIRTCAIFLLTWMKKAGSNMKARVLIVDDEPAIIQMIACVLEIRGYEVVSAGDGLEALNRLEDKRPDMIITDLVMPNMDGLQLCKKVKGDQRWADIPLLVITSATQETDLPDGFWRLGTPADDFLTKPFDPFDVADRIEKMIEQGAPELPGDEAK